NDTVSIDFRTKTRNDFGNLQLTLQGKPDKPFWIQLLTEKDELVDEKYTTETVFEYNYLVPGNYYFKIMVDENENGCWDTGDFFTQKQPESIYTYPAYVNVRALRNVEETWILTKPEEPVIKEDPSTETGEDSP